MSSRLLSTAEVAEILGISAQALYVMRYHRQAPPAVRIGGRVRWIETDLVQWIEDHRENSLGGSP